MKESPLVRQADITVWFLMTDIAREFRQLVDVEMRSLGLTRAQWYVLSHVYHFDGLTQQQLADLLDMGKSSTGKLIVKLEKKGWLQREADESDARSFRVYLPRSIRPAIRELIRFAGTVIEHPFTKFESKEIDQLIGLLRKMERAMEETPQKSRAALDARKVSIARKLGIADARQLKPTTPAKKKQPK